jgi:hypothetical protein
MNAATNPAKQTEGEAPRLSPLETFVAWVATFIAMITGMKRRKAFPPNWRYHWQGLRELEWYRDQILAFSAQHVFAGGSLEERTDHQLILDVPDGYGVCPSTPEAMNRRFILAAAFNLNPNKFILRHIQRIAKREGIALIMTANGSPLRLALQSTSPSFAGGGKTPAPIASRGVAGGGGMRVLHAHDGGGLAFSARGPPAPTLSPRIPITSPPSRAARTPPHARISGNIGN